MNPKPAQHGSGTPRVARSLRLPSAEAPEPASASLRQPSLAASDTSEVGLMELGAPAAAAQLRRGGAAGAAGDGGSEGGMASAGGAGDRPAHLVYRREVVLDVPADQVEEAVAAIVHMQPLPVSRPGSAAPPSPMAEGSPQARSPTPSSPGWVVVSDHTTQQPEQQQQQQQQHESLVGSATEGQRQWAGQPSQLAASPSEPSSSSDSNQSVHSMHSTHSSLYESIGSAADPALESWGSASSSWSGPSSGAPHEPSAAAAAAAASGDAWRQQPVQLRVPPPPRPGAAAGPAEPGGMEEYDRAVALVGRQAAGELQEERPAQEVQQAQQAGQQAAPTRPAAGERQSEAQQAQQQAQQQAVRASVERQQRESPEGSRAPHASPAVSPTNGSPPQGSSPPAATSPSGPLKASPFALPAGQRSAPASPATPMAEAPARPAWQQSPGPGSTAGMPAAQDRLPDGRAWPARAAPPWQQAQQQVQQQAQLQQQEARQEQVQQQHAEQRRAQQQLAEQQAQREMPQSPPRQQQAQREMPKSPPRQQQQPAAEELSPRWVPAPARRSRLAISVTAPLAAATFEGAALPPAHAVHALPGVLEQPAGSAAESRASAGVPAPLLPHSSSDNEPQMTEIRGPWPPPLHSLPISGSPRLGRRSPRDASGDHSSASMTSAFQQHSPHSANQSVHSTHAWRQLDDGNGAQPGGEVDWTPGAEGIPPASAFAASKLIQDPLVEAASHSPPLSPISEQLLAHAPSHRQPSGSLQRGPQRAASLGLGAAESIPSPLSHEHHQMSPRSQHSPPRQQQQLSPPRFQQQPPEGLPSLPWAPHAPPSSPSVPISPSPGVQRGSEQQVSPVRQEEGTATVAVALGLGHVGAHQVSAFRREEDMRPPSASTGLLQVSERQASAGSQLVEAIQRFNLSPRARQTGRAGQEAGEAEEAPRQHVSMLPVPAPEISPAGQEEDEQTPRQRLPMLPVLNTSPDVSPSTAAAPGPSSPFPTPLPPVALAAAANYVAPDGGGFNGIGGLPLEVVEKRDRFHHRAESPREAYASLSAQEQGEALSQPLLAGSEAGADTADIEEDDVANLSSLSSAGTGRARGGGSVWVGASLMASSMLGAGLVAVPRAFALMGLVAGGASLAGASLLAFLSSHVLVSARSASGRPWRCYADVARAALGPAGALLADAALALHCFGMMAAGLLVVGDLLVGSGADGLLGDWGGNRETALGVLALLVLVPLLLFRDLSRLSATSVLAVTATFSAAATTLALTVLAARQGATQGLPWWPSWAPLGGGSRSGRAAGVLELMAVAPVLLVTTLHQVALHPVALQSQPRRRTSLPSLRSRAQGASGLALLYCSALAALLGVCCCALFGGGVQANAVNDFTPEALVSLAGEGAGRAAFLLVRLAFLISLLASFPLLVTPFRDSVWRVLFWQPLLPGPGFFLVTLAALAGAAWASLQIESLWVLLSLLGATTASILALCLPGLVAFHSGSYASGALLVAAGLACAVAGTVRLSFFPSPAE